MKVGDLIKLIPHPEKGRPAAMGLIADVSERSDWVYVEFVDTSRTSKWYDPAELEILSASR